MKKAPKVGTSKSSPNKSKKEVQKLANGGWAQANANLEGKSSLINAGTSAVGDVTLLGGTAMAANNQVDEQGNINVKKSTGAGALTGAGTGIKTGAALGSIFGPVGTLVGAGAGAVVGGGIGAITSNKKAKKFNTENAESILEQQKLDQEIARRSTLAQGMYNRNLENYADGGEIKGKGTAKSDSIKAKVKEGSFVVPAEASGIAEQLREKVLVKAPKKANLKQSGGVDVKLSNGEHIFTPEEVNELMQEGIDLNKLAPDAKNRLSNHLNCGGKIKGYKDGNIVVDPAKEKQKIKQDAAQKQKFEKEFEGESKNYYERKKLEEEQYNRVKRINDATKAREKKSAEYEKLKAEKGNSKSIYDKEELINKLAEIEELDKEIGSLKQTVNKVATETKAPMADSKKQPSALKLSANEIEQVNQPTNNTVTPQLSGDGKVESVTGGSDVEFVPRKKAPSIPKKEVVAIPPVEQITPITPKLDVPAAEIKDTSALAKQLSAPTTTTPTPSTSATTPAPTPTPVAAGGTDYDKIGSVLAQAMSYGVPIAQTAIGMNALKKAGKRPVNTIPADYLGMIDQANAATALAQKNAQFGFTPEEQALLNQQNQSATNAGIYAARNLSGGSAANALGNTRSALADSFGRNLQTKVQNRDLMLQKQDIANQRQQYANSLTAGKTALLNNIFDQKLEGWMQTQQAGGQLVGAGISNISAANRYNQFLKQQEALNK